MASANVFAGLLQPPKSIYDYQQQLGQIDTQRAALAQVQRENALKDAEMARAEMERNKFAELINASGGDQGKLISGLMGPGSTPGLYGQGVKMQAGQVEAEQKRAQMERDRAAAGKSQEETVSARLLKYREAIGRAPNPDVAAQIIMAQYSDPLVGPIAQKLGPLMSVANEIPRDDPAKFDAWRTRQALGMEQLAQHLDRQQTAAMVDARTREAAAMTDARIRSEGAANRAVQMRGQNLTDARTRDRLVTDKEAAAERRAAEKAETGVNKYAAALQKEGLPELDAAISLAENELNKYASGKAPGVGFGVGYLPEAALSSEGKRLRQAIASVRNIVLSARSGAAVTDQELRRMVEELGSSGLNTEEALRNGLAAVRERLEAIKANTAAGVPDEIKETYEARGGLKITRGGKKPPSPAAASAPGWSIKPKP